MDKIKLLTDLLDKAEIEYTLFHHEAAHTIDKCKEIEILTQSPIPKNLFLRTTNGEKRYLLIISGEKKFNTGKVSKLLNSSRLSFCGADEMEKLLSTAPGSLSVLSLLFDKNKSVMLAVDADVLKEEYFCCHPCDNTTTVKFKTSEIENKLLPFIGITANIIEIE